MTVADLAGSEAQVGTLYDQEAQPEFAWRLEPDHRRARHGQQRGQQMHRRESSGQRVVEQRHVQRREDREQQHLRHGQQQEGLVEEHVHQAELHRAQAHQRQLVPAGQPTEGKKRQEQRGRQRHPGQHREVVVDLAGQVLADQRE